MPSIDDIFCSHSHVLMSSAMCSNCGAERETMRHCGHCGHDEPEPVQRTSTPATVTGTGISIDDVFQSKSHVVQLAPACTQCGSDVQLIDGKIICQVCGRRPGTDGASLVSPGQAQKPTQLPSSQCFKTDDCSGVHREMRAGFDRDGKMLDAKMTCPICGSYEDDIVKIDRGEIAPTEPKNEIEPEPRANPEPAATQPQVIAQIPATEAPKAPPESQQQTRNKRNKSRR
jgi:hypothetical protein